MKRVTLWAVAVAVVAVAVDSPPSEEEQNVIFLIVVVVAMARESKLMGLLWGRGWYWDLGWGKARRRWNQPTHCHWNCIYGRSRAVLSLAIGFHTEATVAAETGGLQNDRRRQHFAGDYAMGMDYEVLHLGYDDGSNPKGAQPTCTCTLLALASTSAAWAGSYEYAPAME